MLKAARVKGIVELVVTIAVAIFFVLTMQAYAVKPYRVPSGSMEPTLHIGQRLIVERFSHRFLGAEPKVGQIIVFHPPEGADPAEPVCGAQRQGDGTRTPCDRPTAERSSQTFVKRVVAVGGDRISIRGGHVIRNGRLQPEPFAARCQPGGGCDFTSTVTVPKGYVFLMGDNRGNSDDSRYWGPVPRAWVIGKAVATYWPPDRLGAF